MSKFIDESLARGISKKIIREMFEYMQNSTSEYRYALLPSWSVKRKFRELKNLCKSKSNLVLIEEKNSQRSSCKMLWGEWNLSYTGTTVSPVHYKDVDGLAFALSYTTKKGTQSDFLFIVLSKHALVRMVMRSRANITTPENAFKFLKVLSRDLTAACFGLLDGDSGSILFSQGFYLPIVEERGLNTRYNPQVSFVVKTVMPQHFKVNVNEIIHIAAATKPIVDRLHYFSLERHNYFL